MDIGDRSDQSMDDEAAKRLEELSLRQLLPYWSNLLWQTSVRPWIQKMSQIDLTISESQILRHLQDQSLTIAEVAEYLSITPSAASRAVDRLVHDGFVSRAENPTDRRQKQLLLTASGVALLADHSHTLIDGIERLIGSLPPAEQELFHRLLAHMVAANPAEAGLAHIDTSTDRTE
jgi:DNA-binding MarR family transcriptional regulator